MNKDLNYSYEKSIALLQKSQTSRGFVASIQDVDNYQRVWARDGVIIGLASLSSQKTELIETFKATLETLAQNQHSSGFIPSNVYYKATEPIVSYGGLAGRVDALTWFIIGVCQLTIQTGNVEWFNKMEPNLLRGFQTLACWEFNGQHLLYCPLSGNWADEYITDGYVLYDQILYLWANKLYAEIKNDQNFKTKAKNIENQILINFWNKNDNQKIHPRAFVDANVTHFLPCSFNPSGYKNYFDSFAHALVLLMNFSDENLNKSIKSFIKNMADERNSYVFPAFHPPIFEENSDWNLLHNNYKFHFRNYPYEFHNGGIWPMINGFLACSLQNQMENQLAYSILENVHDLLVNEDYGFNENYHGLSQKPIGVPYCTWSAAGFILAYNSIFKNFKL